MQVIADDRYDMVPKARTLPAMFHVFCFFGVVGQCVVVFDGRWPCDTVPVNRPSSCVSPPLPRLEY